MANLLVRDGAEAAKYMKASGAGTDVDPLVTHHGLESNVLEVTLSLDTNIYASGDVLAATQEMANAVRVNGGTAVLQSLVLLDKDDQGGALDLLILQTTQDIGTENAAHAISDDEADEILTIIPIAAGDYYDLTNSMLVRKNSSDSGMGMVLKAAAGSTSLFIAAISKGAKTYTASGINLKLGLLLD